MVTSHLVRLANGMPKKAHDVWSHMVTYAIELSQEIPERVRTTLSLATKIHLQLCCNSSSLVVDGL